MHSSLMQLQQQQQALEQRMQQQDAAGRSAGGGSNSVSGQQFSSITTQMEGLRKLMANVSARVDVLDAHLQQEKASSLQALEAILSDTTRA